MTRDAYNFPLSWRWTQPTHNVLPPEVMAQIKPLDQSAEPLGATQLRQIAFSFDLVHTTSADVSADKGRDWLRALPVSPSERVIVCWDAGPAVQTTWEIFTQYWNDFCYPASDDVTIHPPTDDWVLIYHHNERFAWGRRAAQPEQSD